MAFNGLATFSSSVFATAAIDISEEIGMISPTETLLLDALSQAPRPATSLLHEWLEEALGPNTVVGSTAHADTTSTGLGIVGGLAQYLQVGMILKNTRTAEFVQISAITVNTLTLTRGFGSTAAATIAAGDSFFVISTAELEGADVARDVSIPRSRKNNYVQLFKKDVILSGTMEAQAMYGVSGEFDHQQTNRTKEILRDLEKAAISGKSSGNTIGSATAYRTFSGIWDQIVTNSTSLATIGSIGQIEDVIQGAWTNGATDLDLIVCDNIKHRQLSNLQFARATVTQDVSDNYVIKKNIEVLQTSYGDHKVLRSRWMPSNSMLVISSGRVHVVPFGGRSFQFQEVGRTGDSRKGFIVGEYTVEVHNEEGMAKAFG